MWNEDQEHRALSRMRGVKGGAGEEVGGHVRKTMGVQGWARDKSSGGSGGRSHVYLKILSSTSASAHWAMVDVLKGDGYMRHRELERVCKVESCSLPISIS